MVVEKIGRKDLSNLVQGDYDFVARVDTPYHLLNLKAYLKSVLSTQKIKGIILIGKHPTSKYLLDRDRIDIDPLVEINAYYYSQECSSDVMVPEVVADKNKTLTIIHPDRAWSFLSVECKKTRKRVEAVIIDDGIGTYFGSGKRAVTTIRDNGSLLVGAKYLLGRIGGNALMHLSGVHVTCFSLFLKKQFANQLVVDCLKNEIIVESNNCERIAFEPKSVVYISQPNTNIDFYHRTVEIGKTKLRELRDNGYKVYVKLHPREMQTDIWGKDEFCILPNMPIESIIAASTAKPTLIVGWTSTALITLSLMWNIESISLAKLYNDELKHRNLRNFIKVASEQQKKLPNLQLVEKDVE